MDLKAVLPNKEKKVKVDYYWSLILEPEWIQASIWQVTNDEAQVISTSTPVAWGLDEELVSTVDTALSAAVQNLQEEIKEPSDTVIGVLSSWVSGGEIRPEYLAKIKKICSELSLKPVGFVVLSEAIAHYFKSQEGSPLSAVVLGVSKESLEVSVFRLGNLVGTKEVARSLSIVDDVSEGLARFPSDSPFPSRFILYDGREGELEELRQVLIKADWGDVEKIKFLHTPKIEVIKPEKKLHAVSLAGASDLASAELIGAKKETIKGDEKEANLLGEDDAFAGIKPEEFGFVVGKDISARTKEFDTESSKPKEEITKDVEKVTLNKKVLVAKKENAGENQPEKMNTTRKPWIIKWPVLLRKFWLKPSKSSSVKLPDQKPAKKAYVFGGVFFLLITLLAFSSWWFLPRATVTLYLSTKRLEEPIKIVVDPKVKEAGIENQVLPGKVLTVEVSGDKTKSTSGVKTVGEKAKGEVTLLRAGSKLNLAAGTELIGPGDLKYSLDDDVVVASGSVGSPGSVKARVTAIGIGAEYNLASDTSFAVGNYALSDIEAKNETAFSGGSSREISSVSEEDQKELQDDLTAELKEKAIKKLMDQSLNEVCSGCLVVKESVDSSILSRSFDKKVGDEATSLKLNLTLNSQAVALDRDALVKLAEEVLKDRVPEGYILRAKQIDVSFEYKGEDSGQYSFVANVKADLFPEVDPVRVSDKIAGTYPQIARDFLTREIPGFTRAEISFKPRLPGRLGTLPHIAKNIEVEIAAAR